MPLYIAPHEYREPVAKYLKEKYPEIIWVEKKSSFAEARRLVVKTCEDTAETQPAVKLVSLFHEFIVSIWFGMELHVYDGYGSLKNADPTKVKFLFHGGKREDPWMLVQPHASQQ